MRGCQHPTPWQWQRRRAACWRNRRASRSAFPAQTARPVPARHATSLPVTATAATGTVCGLGWFDLYLWYKSGEVMQVVDLALKPTLETSGLKIAAIARN